MTSYTSRRHWGFCTCFFGWSSPCSAPDLAHSFKGWHFRDRQLWMSISLSCTWVLFSTLLIIPKVHFILYPFVPQSLLYKATSNRFTTERLRPFTTAPSWQLFHVKRVFGYKTSFNGSTLSAFQLLWFTSLLSPLICDVQGKCLILPTFVVVLGLSGSCCTNLEVYQHAHLSPNANSNLSCFSTMGMQDFIIPAFSPMQESGTNMSKSYRFQQT